MTTPQLRVLTAADADLLDDAYARVFRPSFDTTELPGPALLSPGEGRVVLVAIDGGSVVGGAVSDTFPGSDIGLLSYMATHPDVRGQGVGAQMLVSLREHWAADAIPLVLGEVRDPRAWDRTDA